MDGGSQIGKSTVIWWLLSDLGIVPGQVELLFDPVCVTLPPVGVVVIPQQLVLVLADLTLHLLTQLLLHLLHHLVGVRGHGLYTRSQRFKIIKTAHNSKLYI